MPRHLCPCSPLWLNPGRSQLAKTFVMPVSLPPPEEFVWPAEFTGTTLSLLTCVNMPAELEELFVGCVPSLLDFVCRGPPFPLPFPLSLSLHLPLGVPCWLSHAACCAIQFACSCAWYMPISAFHCAACACIAMCQFHAACHQAVCAAYCAAARCQAMPPGGKACGGIPGIWT